MCGVFRSGWQIAGYPGSHPSTVYGWQAKCNLHVVGEGDVGTPSWRKQVAPRPERRGTVRSHVTASRTTVRPESANPSEPPNPLRRQHSSGGEGGPAPCSWRSGTRVPAGSSSVGAVVWRPTEVDSRQGGGACWTSVIRVGRGRRAVVTVRQPAGGSG